MRKYYLASLLMYIPVILACIYFKTPLPIAIVVGMICGFFLGKWAREMGNRKL